MEDVAKGAGVSTREEVLVRRETRTPSNTPVDCHLESLFKYEDRQISAVRKQLLLAHLKRTGAWLPGEEALLEIEKHIDTSTWTIQSVDFNRDWCISVRATSPTCGDKTLLWYPYASKGGIDTARSTLVAHATLDALTLTCNENADIRYIIM
jgi:hypothetical protein